MPSMIAIPVDALANVQGFSQTGVQRDDGHLATSPKEILSLVAAHHTNDSVRVHPPTDFANRQREEMEIEWLKTAPDRMFLYVRHVDRGDHRPMFITTWLGTVVSTTATFGRRSRAGFGHAYRRSVDCLIFGTRYVGWYYESSGNYCRLRKSTRQPKGGAR